jgi:hypothetical protein
MGKVGFIKGLAAGAVLGAVASLLMGMEEKERDEKMSAIKKTAGEIKDRVADHAKKLGKLTKTAYDKIVETTVAEYRGVKALSETELSELKRDLKGSWSQIEKMIKKGGKKRK